MKHIKIFNNHNSLKCLKCEDKIMSYFTHDFNHCKCGASFIDGGCDYTRMGYNSVDEIEMFVGDWEVNMKTGQKTLLGVSGTIKEETENDKPTLSK